MSEIYFKRLMRKDKETFTKINEELLQVSYEESVYDAFFAGESYKVCLIMESGSLGESRVIGAFALLASDSTAYLFTFGILAQYQRQGKGRYSLLLIEKYLKEELGCSYLELHTQTSNVIARDFYISNGYTVKEVVDDYYVEVFPTSAYKLGKHI